MDPRAPLTLAVALLLCGCSQEGGSATSPAGEASPAPGAATSVQHATAQVPTGTPDLSHVRVGQRYTFALEQAGTKMQMVWRVSAITATEVRYAVSVAKNGTALSPPTETSWPIPQPKGDSHDHDDSSKTKKPPKPSPETKTTFETLNLAGRDWTCRVTVSKDVKTWTALSGGAPTFPPLLKQTTGVVVSSVLLKIDG